jgi:general secretion pathway protein E
MDDPWNVEARRQIAQRTAGIPEAIWVTRATLLHFLEQLDNSPPLSHTGLEGEPEAGVAKDETVSEVGYRIDAASVQEVGNEVVRYVDRQVLDAWRAAASDIHVEMLRDGFCVKFRIDGVLIDSPVVGSAGVAGEALINRIKVLAKLDISETRIPQDGRFRVVLGGRGVDFRVSIMPSIFGEDAVLRLLDKAQFRGDDTRIDMARLGLDEACTSRLRSAALEPHGMILITGPTGSGKTTTLYALLSQTRRRDEKVITIEDPVEYELPGILQIPVNEKKGLTFARGLRSILRHDPDKILVGEIRDSETAEIAVQAALTGHLVFTTVHANNVYDVVGRFLHMNVDLYGFVSALNCIVAQRLIRLNCEHCRRPVNDPAALKALDQEGFSDDCVMMRSTGCARCRGTGFGGRSAVAEVLSVDDGFRELVVARASGRVLREHVARLQVVPLRRNALQLLATGRTTYEEIVRVVGTSA